MDRLRLHILISSVYCNFLFFYRSPVLGFPTTPDAPAKLRPLSPRPIPTNTKRGSILTPVASDRPSSRPFSRKSRNRAPPFPITKRVPLSGSKLPEHPPRRNIPPSVGGTGCASGHRPNLTPPIARMQHSCLFARENPLISRERLSFSTTRRPARPKRSRGDSEPNTTSSGPLKQQNEHATCTSMLKLML